MITKFTKPNLQTLRAEIQAALTVVGQKHGIQLTYGSVSYEMDGNFFDAKIHGAVLQNGIVQTREAADFKTNAEYFGLKPEDLGAEIQHDDSTYKVTGLSVKSRKYPILVQNQSDGKTYKFTAGLVQRCLGRDKED